MKERKDTKGRAKGKQLPPDVLDFFRKQGALGGRIGGKKSLVTMSPEERTARAKKASLAASEARKAKKPVGPKLGS